MSQPPPVPHSDLTYRIIGCAMEVHNELGPGLRENTYHKALSARMAEHGLVFDDEKGVEVALGDTRAGLLRVDHIVEDAVVVEEKALSHPLTSDELAQVITYLAATGLPVGRLINFGRRRLEYKRVLRPLKLDRWSERVTRYLVGRPS
jgi:GxxExxY protein